MSLTGAEKLKIVERALWEGVEKRPENEVVIEPGWVQVTTPNAPTAFLNGVSRSELSPEEAPDRVRQTVSRYRERKLPFRWKLGPSSSPGDLRSLLEEHGLELKETLYGLIADPEHLKISGNRQVRVEQLSLANLEDWLKVQAAAWKVPPPGITHMRHKMGNSLERGDETYLNYLAYYQDEPVASAALRYFPSYAFLVGAAVNPEVRGQGIYRALLAHRMEKIKEKRLPAVIHCLENTSAPICLRLGFEKVCEIYSFEPKAW